MGEYTIKFTWKYLLSFANPGMFADRKVTWLLFESWKDNSCGAILVGAHQSCFGRFDSETSTCQGNLLGTVNSAEDCCYSSPRGEGGGYVAAGSQDCMSCTSFIGKCTKACVIIMCGSRTYVCSARGHTTFAWRLGSLAKRRSLNERQLHEGQLHEETVLLKSFYRSFW